MIDIKNTEGGVDDLDGGDAVVSAGELEFREATVGRTIVTPEGIAYPSDGLTTAVELGCTVVELFDVLTERENWEYSEEDDEERKHCCEDVIGMEMEMEMEVEVELMVNQSEVA